MLEAGATNIIGCDSQGIVHAGREGLNPSKQWFAEHTNPDGITGGLSDAVRGAVCVCTTSMPSKARPRSASTAASRDFGSLIANR